MPEPLCTYELGSDWIDSGTTALTRNRPPGCPSNISGEDQALAPLMQQVFLSPAFRNSVQVTSSMTAPMAWDSYWRMAYESADKVLQTQANELLKRGNITKLEFEELVKARNRLVVEFRKPLSPFGKQYSEILKSAT